MVPAIEDGWLQRRLAERARERKAQIDSGERVVVGQNHFRDPDERQDFGEVFRVDPDAARRIVERHDDVRRRRDAAAVRRALDRLSAAAATDDENVMPHLVECCHAYATVGEMVAALKEHWGEFQEPVGL